MIFFSFLQSLISLSKFSKNQEGEIKANASLKLTIFGKFALRYKKRISKLSGSHELSLEFSGITMIPF